MLYKLDTLKRKSAEDPTATGSSTPNGSKSRSAPPPEPEIKKPTYTAKQV
jgi:hypothetical protein